MSYFFSVTIETTETLQADKHQLDTELTSARDKLSELLEDYNTLQQEVSQLRGQQEAVDQLRDHVEQQHQALTEGANDAEKGGFYREMNAVLGAKTLLTNRSGMRDT